MYWNAGYVQTFWPIFFYKVYLFFVALKGLVGVVTGAASGLGRATAERFVREGAKVVICDLPKSTGQEVADQLGSDAVFCPTDVCEMYYS